MLNVLQMENVTYQRKPLIKIDNKKNDLLYETIQKDGIKGVHGFFYAIYKETAEKW